MWGTNNKTCQQKLSRLGRTFGNRTPYMGDRGYQNCEQPDMYSCEASMGSFWWCIFGYNATVSARTPITRALINPAGQLGRTHICGARRGRPVPLQVSFRYGHHSIYKVLAHRILSALEAPFSLFPFPSQRSLFHPR